MLGIEFIIVCLILGIFVGIAAGLFGIGGGALMVPLLAILFSWQHVAQEQAMLLALGSSMAAIIMTSAASLYHHQQLQGIRWPIVLSMAPGMVAGALLSSSLATLIDSRYLALFFSLFTAYVAIQMFCNFQPDSQRQLCSRPTLLASGCGIGSISALVSIGGGTLTVPFLSWQNIPLKQAIGTSAALGLPISLAGSLGYALQPASSALPYSSGNIYWPAVILISGCSIFTTRLGARLAHRLPVNKLKKGFALLLVLLSLNMLLIIT